MTFPSESFLKFCVISKEECLTGYDRQPALGHWEQKLETETSNIMWFVLLICYCLTFVLRPLISFYFSFSHLETLNILCHSILVTQREPKDLLTPFTFPTLPIWHVTRRACWLLTLPLCTHTLLPSTSAIYPALRHLDRSCHDLLRGDLVLGRLPGWLSYESLVMATAVSLLKR